MTGEFMAEEQKARMQAIKDSEFRAANDEGEPAQTSPESGLAASPPEQARWDVCTVHESRVRVGPGGRPGDERCERAELHLAFQPSVGVRTCSVVPVVVRIDGDETE